MKVLAKTGKGKQIDDQVRSLKLVAENDQDEEVLAMLHRWVQTTALVHWLHEQEERAAGKGDRSVRCGICGVDSDYTEVDESNLRSAGWQYVTVRTGRQPQRRWECVQCQRS